LNCATSTNKTAKVGPSRPKTGQRLLFVGPALHEVGGVSIYCQTILASYPGTIEYFPFPLGMRRNPLTFLAVLFRFLRRIAGNPRPLVQLNSSFNASALYRDAIFLLLALLFSCRVAVFIHGWEPSFQNSLTGWRRALFRALFNRSAVIFVLAGVFRDSLLSMGISTNIVVETTCFPADIDHGSAPPTVERDHASPAPRILFLSRVVREKGAYELVEACSRLLSDFPGLRLDIAGEGPDLAQLKEYAASKRHGFVAFHGCVTGTAKWSLFREATIFSLPTYYGEGLPVTIMEAMYFGLPIVTTLVGGIADIFVCGENGLTVEPHDVEQLAQRLRQLLSDPEGRKRISRNNAQYSRSRFAPEVVARRLAGAHALAGSGALR
jgi:glycosyltransferase involved in cell wall biosynthesis